MNTKELKASCIKQKKDLLKELKDVRSEYRIAKGETTTLNKRLSEHNKNLRNLNKKFNNEEKEKAALKSAVNTAEQKIQDVSNQISSAQNRLDKLPFFSIFKKKELMEEIERNERYISDARKELSDKEQQLSALSGSETSKLIDDEKKVISDVTKELGNANAKNKQFETTITRLQAKISGLETKIAEYDKILSEEAKAAADAKKKADKKAADKNKDETKAESDTLPEKKQKKQDSEAAKEKANKKTAEKAEKKVKTEAESDFQDKTDTDKKRKNESKSQAEIGKKEKPESKTDIKAESDTHSGKTQKKQKSEVSADKSSETVSDTKSLRPRISDADLAKKVDRAIDKLEQYFPEHKIFSLDYIDDSLRESLSKQSKKLGYETVNDMYAAYGFEVISGDDIKKLRNSVLYKPGEEPEFIKSKTDSMLSRLDKYYPEKVISGSMRADHSNLYDNISGLYKWFGYPSIKDMLEAYGYTCNAEFKPGRRSNDYQPVLDALIEKYKDAPKPDSLKKLKDENPDLKNSLKSLGSSSNKLFGMTLSEYLCKLGILEKDFKESPAKTNSNITITKERAIEMFAARYENIDVQKYGEAEKAVKCLDCMDVNVNSSGRIEIKKANDCKGSVTIPFGIDYVYPSAFSSQKEITDIKIDAELSEITKRCFMNCAKLSSITIPEGVTAIRESAFTNCVSLKSIVLPSSLELVEKNAFSGCSLLEDVQVKGDKTFIDEKAFARCPSVRVNDSRNFKITIDNEGNALIDGYTGIYKTVIIPEMIGDHLVTTISEGAFQGMKNIVTVIMPDTITTIQDNAFKDCAKLEEIHISNSVSNIPNTTFSGCFKLSKVNIPDCVTEIEEHSFTDLGLSEIYIGKSLRTISTRTFLDPSERPRKYQKRIKIITIDPANPYLKYTGLAVFSKDGKELHCSLGYEQSYIIPDGVERISDYAFKEHTGLEDVTFPDSLVSIGEKAFTGADIKKIKFGPNLKVIEREAFSGCNELKRVKFNEGLEKICAGAFRWAPIPTVTLPASLKELGEESFSCLCNYPSYHASSLKQKLEIDPDNPYYKTDGKALYIINDNGKTLQEVCENHFKLNNSGNYKIEQYCVEDGTIAIAPHAFERCRNLKYVKLPEGLQIIGDRAFADCDRLESIDLPESLISVGNEAFTNCPQLRHIDFHDRPVSIGDRAFADCIQLDWLMNSEGLVSVGNGAFAHTWLYSFHFGPNLSEIGEAAFISLNAGDRNRISEIDISEDNTNFSSDDSALYRRKTDGSRALMKYFGKEDSIIIPEDITGIESCAFIGSRVQKIRIPATVKYIGADAFKYCYKLSWIEIEIPGANNTGSYTAIYIPDFGVYAHSGGEIRRCIYLDESKGPFDFAEYDRICEKESAERKEKVLIAVSRLKSAIQLSPQYRDEYIEYLRANANRAVDVIVKNNDVSLFSVLDEYGICTANNIDKAIEFATNNKRTEMVSYLMNYKNSKFGMDDEKYEL